MKIIEGTYSTAKVFTDTVDETALQQIAALCDQPFSEGSQIRIMPDVHAGAGCTIGTTMTIKQRKIVPNLVGVDIGCGVMVCELANKSIDFDKLDAQVRRVPSGFNIREKKHDNAKQIEVSELACLSSIDHDRALLSVGTLGGGNHFIEVDVDDYGHYYLVIHTGSRHAGLEVAHYYQKAAIAQMNDISAKTAALIRKLKEERRESEIPAALRRLYEEKPGDKLELAFVSDDLFDSYIHDMKIMQHFARVNRSTIAESICSGMDFEVLNSFSTVHNYIDIESMILRKGAVSALANEELIIPINMRDGSLICKGKGNPEWNYSAPHGAGRLMSRAEARQKLSLREFESEMKGVYSTCVGRDTLDESPMAYKGIQDILSNVGDTVEVLKVIKPVYNFKAAEASRSSR